jgi:hypothetical protein
MISNKCILMTNTLAYSAINSSYNQKDLKSNTQIILYWNISIRSNKDKGVIKRGSSIWISHESLGLPRIYIVHQAGGL